MKHNKRNFGIALAALGLVALFLGAKQENRSVAGMKRAKARRVLASGQMTQSKSIQVKRLQDGGFEIAVPADGVAPEVRATQDRQAIAVSTPVAGQRIGDFQTWIVRAANTELTLRVKHGGEFLAMSFLPFGATTSARSLSPAGPAPVVLRRANGETRSVKVIPLQ